MIEQWRDLWDRYHAWVGAFITAALVLICYGFALRLPFYYDDLPIMTWLRRHTWLDIWTMSSEGDYFRPLTFTVYKLGRLFPPGTSQGVLHGTNVLLHWASSLLVMQVVRLSDRDPEEALLASVLFAVFPFMATAVPWVTAMPHLLVTTLTLLAVFSALKAERDQKAGWWYVSLVAMVLAPTAHESGVVSAVIVGGVIALRHGLRGHRGTLPILLGGTLNVAAVFVRGWVPGVREAAFVGLQDWLKNMMIFLQGLVYPVAPVIGRLVRQYGAHDFTLIAAATAGFLGLLVWSLRERRDRRYSAIGLWWWACAVLPAAASLGYGYLYTAPRIHALSTVGLAMLWAGLILGLGRAVWSGWGRRLASVALVGLILTQNIAFLRSQRSLFGLVSGVYEGVLAAAEHKDEAPLGFVNLPRGVGRHETTYPLTHEAVLFMPPYSNIAEFIEVNGTHRPADAVMYSPVLQEPDIDFSFQGKGLTWEEMRQFALDHRTVWLSQWKDGRFQLRHVGTMEGNRDSPPDERLVRFDDGTGITAASVERIAEGAWSVTIEWAAVGPVDAQIFVHLVDADGNLVAQMDGPALGGMIPPWAWRRGDRIHDVRHVSAEGTGPYTVRVGLFNADGRYPARKNGSRCPDDACSVATLLP
jgi:hypothetical protein